ncbi:MAG TPA: lamin tail domain-containing protein [Vitreimonas sp.]|nr:lamin tail domain-containing protein [Vitreimonas sp.]
MTKFLLFSLLVSFFLMTAPGSVKAAVIINELHPAPSTGEEWIELYNTGPETVDLSGWQLWDAISVPSLIHTLESGLLLAPHSYHVVEVSNKLNNGGDNISLKTPALINMDGVSYSSTQTDMSWARSPNGEVVAEFKLQAPSRSYPNPALPSPSPNPSPSVVPSSSPIASPLPSATPTPSPSPSPVSYPTHFTPSEIVACPSEGETEWLEIYNSANVSFTLTNWRVRDQSGSSRFVSGLVPAQGWVALSWSGSLLNNSGDSISLETPEGHTLFTVQFGSCNSGRSFVLYQGSWAETLVPTKNISNIIDNISSSPSPFPTPSPSPNGNFSAVEKVIEAELNTPMNSSASLDSTNVSPRSSSFVSQQLDLAQLQLLPSPLLASSSARLAGPVSNLERQTPSKLLTIGAILTGSLLSGGSSWCLYAMVNHPTFHLG